MNSLVKPAIHATAILLLALVAASLTWWIKGPPAKGCDPASLKPGEICIQSIPKDRKVLWIDARSRSDWQRDGLPGSILWNFDAAEDRATMEAEAGMKIFETPYVIVYCSDKGCGTSHKIAERIRELDLGADVHVLHDGWKALKDAGLIK